MPSASGLAEQLRVVVSDDRQQAWVQVHCAAESGAPAPGPDQILAALEAAGIEVTDGVRTRVAELAAKLAGGLAGAGGRAPVEPYLIAEGTAPVEAEDGQFEWAPEYAQEQTAPAGDGQVDYFAQHKIITVPPETVIGRLLSPRDGSPGRDVRGQAHPPRRLKGDPLRLGAGVRIADEATGQVVTTAGGRVVIDRGRLHICELLEIPGDVDFSSGSIESCVDVTVRGTVRAKFSVRTTGSLHVDRAVEAAAIDVGRELVVRGGIFGQEQTGRVRAGGAVVAKLINEGMVRAGGDLSVTKEILNSRVYVSGHARFPRGALIGGRLYAREGVEAGVIGSEACVTTRLAVGRDVNMLRQIHRLEQKAQELGKAANQIRDAVAPLLANLKRLSPGQRERATELLAKADEIESQMDVLRARAAQLAKAGSPVGTPYLIVHECLYPGVQLVFDARDVKIQRPVPGPVRIELRKIDDVTQVACVNRRTGSLAVLPSSDSDLSAPPTDDGFEDGWTDESEPATVKHGRN